MAILTTPRWGIPYPNGAEDPDVPTDLAAIATILDDHAKDDQGTLANRPTSTIPSPGKRGRYYYVTGDPDPNQNGRLYRDHGTGWDEIQVGPIQTGDIADGAVTRAKVPAVFVQATSVAIPTIGAGGTATVTHTWATAFPNTNYACFPAIVDTNGRLELRRNFTAKSATQVSVLIDNPSAASSSGSLQLLGVAFS